MDDGVTWKNFKNPTGTKSITANGTYNVTDYASASVQVSNTPYVSGLSELSASSPRVFNVVNGDYYIWYGNYMQYISGGTVLLTLSTYSEVAIIRATSNVLQNTYGSSTGSPRCWHINVAVK